MRTGSMCEMCTVAATTMEKEATHTLKFEHIVTKVKTTVRRKWQQKRAVSRLTERRRGRQAAKVKRSRKHYA